jgi:AraC-like DNA-binding protein
MSSPKQAWHRLPITRIEDLSDAVLGAGLEATQMSTGALCGALAFAGSGGMVCTSGLIGGRVALNGPLSQHLLTIGIGLDIAPGTAHWHNEVETGNIGVFFPGDEHESLYTCGSLYMTVSLSEERLEEEAAQQELVLDRKVLGGTGVHPRNMDPKFIAAMRSRMWRIHAGQHVHGDGGLDREMLSAAARHLARPPYAPKVGTDPGLHGRIVRRARDYIIDRLPEPISVDEIAAAAFTSRRTLFRAFAELLDDTPLNYVRRLRLHRIRSDLASKGEATRTIARVSNEWGISDPGRMAGWYRGLFGEWPSETLSGHSGGSLRKPKLSENWHDLRRRGFARN